MLNKGVGARHKQTKKPVVGVGYLDIYTTPDFLEKSRNDPRLAELTEIGLSKEWVDIASAIGFDAFLLVWERLDKISTERTEKRQIFVPGFRKWLRYQRNRVILSLKSSGMSHGEIQKQVEKDLKESVSVSHIARLSRQKRVDSSGKKRKETA